jgi:hypothetical protein
MALTKSERSELTFYRKKLESATARLKKQMDTETQRHAAAGDRIAFTVGAEVDKYTKIVLDLETKEET